MHVAMRAQPLAHPMRAQVVFNVTVTKGESSLVFECVSDGTYLDVRHVSHEPASGPESATAYTGAQGSLNRRCAWAAAATRAAAGPSAVPAADVQASWSGLAPRRRAGALSNCP
jgi:hypothetical protein